MRLSGPLFVLIGALCFSFSGTIQSFAPEAATPFTVTEARMVIGTLGLAAFCWAAKKFPNSWSSFNFKFLVLVALCLYGFQLLFFSSLPKTGVAVGTIAAIGSTPIWTAIIEKIVYGKNPSKIWYFSTVTAIVGIVLLNLENFNSTVHWIYLLLPLLAGLCYAGEIVVAPKAMEGVSSESAMVVVMGLVALINAPMLMFFPISWIATAQGLSCAVALGLVTASLAFAFFFTGVRHTKASVASTLGLAEPMGAACWGIFLLHEPYSVWTLVGIGLILVSILVLSLKSD
ncbi:DMT family transporter [Turicimonas muris]|uniref:DMT family transporter n=3 Tax=Turicimonas muris TaxID=1796652 RepID=UPI0024957160|nr:DMT family transporter [Turicimonas muris]